MLTTSKILIVDDTPAALEVLEDLLTPQGYELLLASDGVSAMATAVAHTPDLILLDVMMPDIDGYEVCRQIRAHSVTASIPVIIITALTDTASRLKGIEAGADDFLTKPINRYELRLRVKTIIRLNRYRRLMAERTKFEYVINQVSTGHLIVNQKNQIVFANPQAQRFLNKALDNDAPPDETRDFFAIAHESFRLEPEYAWRNWPEEAPNEAIRYLVRPETKWLKGQWLKVQVLGYEADNEINWLVNLEDVTQQISDFRDIRSFSRMVNHKLRTPLVGLRSGLEIIKNGRGTLDAQQFMELIEIAEQSIKRLTDQIEDVLHYTHVPLVAHGSERFYPEHLPGLIKRVALDMELTTICVLQPECVPVQPLTISENLLEIVLFELLENAQKFHPQNEPVVEVTLAYEDAYALVTVSDNGRYLTLAELDKVWMPYYQIEKIFTGETPGMGLGLPTVASLIWQANGQCRLYNRPDQPGVSVELKIPFLVELNPAQPPEAAPFVTKSAR
jgi:two-component system, cell cycle response regulator